MLKKIIYLENATLKYASSVARELNNFLSEILRKNIKEMTLNRKV
jgi:hypothetical protein